MKIGEEGGVGVLEVMERGDEGEEVTASEASIGEGVGGDSEGDGRSGQLGGGEEEGDSGH
jgi:hypothetical protein